MTPRNALALALLMFVLPLHAGVINFDTGTAGNAIGSFYSAFGVTFSNGSWVNYGLPLPGTSGLVLGDVTDPFLTPVRPSSTSPIVGVFGSSQGSVSIVAADVGANGAKLVAYDATSGGNIVGSDNSQPGIGFGTGNFLTLSVSGSGIRRFELFQPLNVNSGDGVLFDNLQFQPDTQPAPEPYTILLAGLGIALIACVRFRSSGTSHPH